MCSEKKLLGIAARVFVLGAFAPVSVEGAEAPKKIVWVPSGRSASDPSIYHDILQGITEASRAPGDQAVRRRLIVPAYKEVDAVHENVLQLCYTCRMYKSR